MKRWKKMLMAIVALVVVAIAAIPLFVKANTFRPAIEQQLTLALGRAVKLGDLRLSLLSGSLVAKDLSIADDPAFSTDAFLAARELRIGVELRPLILDRQVKLRSFQIESPQINLLRAADGTWNFSSLGRSAATPASSAAINSASSTSKIPAPSLADLSVALITIEDGRAAIATLPLHGDPFVHEHVNFTARNFSFTSQFSFEVRADLPAGGTLGVAGHIGPLNHQDAATSPADAQLTLKHFDPVAAGFLDPNAGLSLLADVEMRAASDGQTLISSGTLHIENLKLRKAAAPASKALDFTCSGTHQMKANAGQIDDASAKIGNAALHANGAYQLGPLATQDMLLNLKLAGQSLPIDELQALMTAAAIRLPNGAVLKGGTLSLNLAVTGPLKSLVLAGPVALDNTRLVGFDLRSKIHGIAALSGVKTGDTTDFEKLRVNVRITNSSVAVDNIDAVIPTLGALSGSGTVSSADQLDFNLLAKVSTAKGISKVGVNLLSKLNGSGDQSGVPLHVVGTPENPSITADVNRIVQKKKAFVFGKHN